MLDRLADPSAELRQLALEAEELLGPGSPERLSEARAEAARETPSPRSPVAAQLAEPSDGRPVQVGGGGDGGAGCC